jgi:hypothetical protein
MGDLFVDFAVVVPHRFVAKVLYVLIRVLDIAKWFVQAVLEHLLVAVAGLDGLLQCPYLLLLLSDEPGFGGFLLE